MGPLARKVMKSFAAKKTMNAKIATATPATMKAMRVVGIVMSSGDGDEQ